MSPCDPDPDPEIVTATFTAGNPPIEENGPPIGHASESLSGWHLPTCICQSCLVRYTITRSSIGSFRLSVSVDGTIAGIALLHALPVLQHQLITGDARPRVGCLTCPGANLGGLNSGGSRRASDRGRMGTERHVSCWDCSLTGRREKTGVIACTGPAGAERTMDR